MLTIEKDVFLPRLTQSLNKTLRQHWAANARKNKSWQHDLAWFFPARPRTKAFRYMAIVSYRKGTPDDDNLRGGCKPVIDALRRLGWLWDDSPDWLKCGYVLKRVGEDGTKETGTRIIFYESEKETCSQKC